MSQAALVRLEHDGGLARITLNRPEAGNAISLDVCRALQEAARFCAACPDVRAVLLKAEGKAFCVGGDLAEFGGMGETRPAQLEEMARIFHAAQHALLTLRAPVVVAVQGPTAGAGVGLAMSGDIVVAARSAHFTLAYTAIGLSADGGSTHLLPRLIGLRRTQELMLTNRRLSATEALEWGLLTSVVEDTDLPSRAEEIADRLARGPTEAFGVIKRLLAATYGRNFVSQTDEEGREIARLAGGADGAEGIEAFLAKRIPRFVGEPGRPA